MKLTSDPRILVVEDQPIVAMSLCDVVEECGGVPVGPAGNLARAARLAAVEELDAAVIDGWRGASWTHLIGEILADRGIPFVVIGGSPACGEPSPFRLAPRLVMPFTAQELRSALETAGMAAGARPAAEAAAPAINPWMTEAPPRRSAELAKRRA